MGLEFLKKSRITAAVIDSQDVPDILAASFADLAPAKGTTIEFIHYTSYKKMLAESPNKNFDWVIGSLFGDSGDSNDCLLNALKQGRDSPHLINTHFSLLRVPGDEFMICSLFEAGLISYEVDKSKFFQNFYSVE